MERLSLNAPAKINIGLNIVSKRMDNFHNLETFFYPIYDLHDKLVFEKNSNFIFDSNDTNLVKDPDNLVIRAHTLLEETVNRRLPIKIFLFKNIPIGAGLGGGSSDAAATLLGLNALLNLDLSLDKLTSLALKLGSDVPFFIKAKPAVGYSRGEVLYQSAMYINKPILIINPGIHISTKDAFKNIIPKDSKVNYKYFLENEVADFNYLSENITNDFEEYVFRNYAEIAKIKELMVKNGCLFTLLSGTGSTVYGIYENWEQAQEVTKQFPPDYFKFISTV